MNLRELRQQKGLEVVNIYRPLKIPRNSWHCYESGRNELPLRLINPLAHALNEPAEIIVACALETRNEYQIKTHPEAIIDTWKQLNSRDDAEADE